MAYVDRQSGAKRAATLASAAIIQGAIGAVLIYGLATDYLRPDKIPDLIARNFPVAPTEKPTEQPAEQTKPDESVVTAPDVVIDTFPSTDIFIDKPKELPDERIAVVDLPRIPDVLPTPKPKLFDIKRARAKNGQSRWVTADDYPGSDLRAEHTGTVKYRVVVSTTGSVSSCEIVQSSGWPGLDKATCDRVSRRAQFEPGTDSSGAKTVDTYNGSVIWKIPEN